MGALRFVLRTFFQGRLADVRYERFEALRGQALAQMTPFPAAELQARMKEQPCRRWPCSELDKDHEEQDEEECL